MKITLENTRALGIGETVLPEDFYVGATTKSLFQVAQPEVGKIITEDEAMEYRRLLGANPYDAIIAELGLETDAGKNALRVFCELVKVLDRKQQDYSSENINAFGEFGVLVRANDKICRLKNLITKSIGPKNESIEDTWMDLCNYALIAIMIRRGLWK